jgi:2-oxo-4-hydroxy-4-carboxy-5-ureidoimidazoline decarboxylase
MAMESAAQLGSAGSAEFVAAVGHCYESSPWVAERAHAAGPFETLTGIEEAMWAAVSAASDEEQLALLNAHPDLAGRAALSGEITAESSEEQRRAGLNSLTQDEMTHFTEMNTAYNTQFGFPFILAIRNATKRTILGAYENRLCNAPGVERDAALAQVRKIAWMRLRMAVTPAPTGKLTCHVLDTARGCPAANMTVTLRYLGGSGGDDMAGPSVVGNFVTNSDGRLDGPALQGADLKEGRYVLTDSFQHVCPAPATARSGYDVLRLPSAPRLTGTSGHLALVSTSRSPVCPRRGRLSLARCQYVLGSTTPKSTITCHCCAARGPSRPIEVAEVDDLDIHERATWTPRTSGSSGKCISVYDEGK